MSYSSYAYDYQSCERICLWDHTRFKPWSDCMRGCYDKFVDPNRRQRDANLDVALKVIAGIGGAIGTVGFLKDAWDHRNNTKVMCMDLALAAGSVAVLALLVMNYDKPFVGDGL